MLNSIEMPVTLMGGDIVQTSMKIDDASHRSNSWGTYLRILKRSTMGLFKSNFELEHGEFGGHPSGTIPSRAGKPEGVETMYHVSLMDKDIVRTNGQPLEFGRNDRAIRKDSNKLECFGRPFAGAVSVAVGD